METEFPGKGVTKLCLVTRVKSSILLVWAIDVNFPEVPKLLYLNDSVDMRLLYLEGCS
jgi:hypothetical protein